MLHKALSKSHRLNHVRSLLLSRLGLQVLFLVFLANTTVIYVARYIIHGQTCMSAAEVQSDSRCLYIYQNNIYEKGTRSRPHQGNDCGTDVSSVIKQTHILEPAYYLDPNLVSTVCSEVQPTATPIPQPSATPQPTAVPTTPPQAPTNTPIPQPTQPGTGGYTAPSPTPTTTTRSLVVLSPTPNRLRGTNPTPTTSPLAKPTQSTDPTPTPISIGSTLDQSSNMPGLPIESQFGRLDGEITPSRPELLRAAVWSKYLGVAGLVSVLITFGLGMALGVSHWKDLRRPHASHA